MTVVRIRETGLLPDGGLAAVVGFGESAEYEVTVTDPADDAVERLLGWYFQEHLRFPFLDHDRRDVAVAQIERYGRELFGQVFGGAGRTDFEVLRRRQFDGCRVEVTGSAAFHRLHWEALRDPGMVEPLAVRVPVVRRVTSQPAKFDLSGAGSSLNVLLVTARPDGPSDVGYRTISRPLVGALRQGALRVQVDLARPGTWAALTARLQQATDLYGSGFYQIVHFDLHGAFVDYASLVTGRAEKRLAFTDREIKPFAGRQGFLFFETVVDGCARPVPAATVAAVMAQHRIPMAVLNACQSAMQDSTSEASLALQLVSAGVPVAVGMAYSVTVSAAEAGMPVLYAGLAANADPVAAAQAMRRALFDDAGRRGFFDQSVDLEDWMLPVVFRQQDLRFQLRDPTGEEEIRHAERHTGSGREPHVEYGGFLGRDLDIHTIEKRILVAGGHNLLLVQGMAGAGKSTLLQHVGWWWQHTGLTERTFTYNYEHRAWTAEQILRDIASRLLDKPAQATLEAKPYLVQLDQITRLLRSRTYLIVIDNAESITASPASIPHSLPAAEQTRLAELLAALLGGRTLVLIGSREPEAWLAPGTFDSNVYQLSGLDPQATSQLTDRILRHHHARHHLDDPAQREALTKLNTLLGGYPLPMTVVLPALATSTPAQILADLQGGGGDTADPVGLIVKAIEYSHGKLDPATQHALLMLAPFTTTLPNRELLALYAGYLAEQPALEQSEPVDLTAAVAEIVRVGLAAPHPQLDSMTQILPVLPYFLRTRLQPQTALLHATQQAHYRLYNAYAAAIHQLLLDHQPQQRALGQAIAAAEYPNLTTALEIALTSRQPLTSLILTLDEALDQASQHTTRRALIEHALGLHQGDTSDARQERGILHNLAGHAALTSYQLDDAHAHYEHALAIHLELDRRGDAAVTYHQLGAVAEEQRRFEQAADYYQQSLAIDLELGNRHGAANAYHQLGVVAQEQRRFEQAVDNYQQSLAIELEFGDRHGAGISYHQLGVVAQLQG
ncbi:tetratricopeptide repeat protein, partial [Rhizocola hellebori]|uniref:tetratricopeptide repeat protein n=1 Tax=Rhizocola hellebori TaxID=1392758 RepID=UPI001941A1BF